MIGFLVLGLINNFGFVVLMTGSEDIMKGMSGTHAEVDVCVCMCVCVHVCSWCILAVCLGA
jgi:hypothetical protein